MYYQNTVTLPLSRLRALHSLLMTVESQMHTKGMTDTALLELRLAPDMFPLVKQIQIITDNAKGMASRMANREIPKYEDSETTLAELMSRIEKTIAYLGTFVEADFADADTAEARFPYFPGQKMVGAGYVISYALPNFFFHLVTAYAILRNAGFEIGKRDYMGSEVALVSE
jgi:uncharacterized protein